MILLAALALAVPPRAATQAMVASYHLARGELHEARRAAEIVPLHDRTAPRDLLDRIMVAEGATLAERERLYGGLPPEHQAPVLGCDAARVAARRTPVLALVAEAARACVAEDRRDALLPLLADLRADPLADDAAVALLRERAR